MRKIINYCLLIVCAAIFTVSFNACEKDGVYNPKQKIKKVYEQDGTSAKQLSQEWTWDKNKLVKIDYYYDNEIDFTERYTYDKNQVVKVDVVEVEGDDYYYKITYDGSKYKKVELYSIGGQLTASYEFTYTKNKISKVAITNYGDVDDKMAKSGFLSSIVPTEVIVEMAAKLKKDITTKADATEVATISYTYDGDNIKEMTYEMSYNSDIYKLQAKGTYNYSSYDKKLNPLYKSFSEDNFVSSKNNPQEAKVSYYFKYSMNYYGYEMEDESRGDYKIQYSYTYDKNFPVEIERKLIEDGSVEIEKTYYEYE